MKCALSTAILTFLTLSLLTSCIKKHANITFSITTDKNILVETNLAGKDSLSVTASADWVLQDLPNWLQTSAPSGHAGITKLYLYFQTNTSTDSLVADMSLSIVGNVSPTTQKIHIKQNGSAPSLVSDKYNLTELPEGQQDSVTITSNINWNIPATDVPAWIVIDKLSGNAGQTKIHFRVAPNLTLVERKSGLSIQPSGGSPQTIQVNQPAGFMISSIQPSSLPSGSVDPVTITGLFDGSITPIVLINGIQATVSSFSNTAIVVTLPPNATSGPVTVLTGNKTLTSPTSFTIVASSHWVKVANACPFNFINGISFVYNNRLYAGLGNDPNQNPNSTFQAFDPATNSCSAAGSLPDSISARSFASSFVIPLNGKNYVYFGLGTAMPGQTTNMQDWWRWDPTVSDATRWQRQSVLPPGGYGAISLVINNKAYEALAYRNQTLIQFDPLGGTGWIVVPMTLPSIQYPVCFTIGSKGYFAGGTKSGTTIRSCYQLDPVNGSYKQMADLPAVISSGSAFSLNNLGYILTNGSSSTLYQFDPLTNTWSDVKDTPASNGYFYTGVINGVAYAWNSVDGAIYKFNP